MVSIDPISSVTALFKIPGSSVTALFKILGSSVTSKIRQQRTFFTSSTFLSLITRLTVMALSTERLKVIWVKRVSTVDDFVFMVHNIHWTVYPTSFT